MDLNVIIQILRFDGEEKRAEPLERPKITADPEEVHLPQPCAALRVVHAVPDALQDRCERCHTDTSSNQHSNFELEDVFRRRTKWPVDVNSWQNLAHSDFLGVLVLLTTSLLVEIAAKSLSEPLGEVADHTNVN